MSSQPILRPAETKLGKAVREALPGKGFVKAFDMWLGLKGQQDLPPVTAISPFNIPKQILADCSVISVEDGEKRFWVRLVGTRVTRSVGVDLTNSWGDDVKNGEDVLRALEMCVQERWPIYFEGPTAWAVHDFKFAKSILMPFAAEDGTVRRVLSYLEFA